MQIGCYGPVESLDECRALYTVKEGDDTGVGCMDGFTDLLLADEAYGEAILTPVDIVRLLCSTAFSHNCMRLHCAPPVFKSRLRTTACAFDITNIT